MRRIQRFAAVGVMAVLTVALSACANSEQASTVPPSAAAPTSVAASSGVTQISDIFGPACNQVLPTSGDGSAQGMVDDPVATAASNNPLVSTLVSAVEEAGVADTLNGAQALTVLAPFNGAFEKIPAAALDQVLGDKPTLTKILTYHVTDKRYDADGLVDAGSITPLAGGSITVAGTADAPTFKGAGNTAAANTLCGNIPTRNATVFVIDAVLMPAM